MYDIFIHIMYRVVLYITFLIGVFLSVKLLFLYWDYITIPFLVELFITFLFISILFSWERFKSLVRYENYKMQCIQEMSHHSIKEEEK